MNTTTAVFIIVFALAALVGAGLGAYVATKPVADKASNAIENMQDVFQKEAQRAADALENMKIDVPPVEVPQPQFTVTLSPWSAFFLFAATVAGILSASIFRKSHVGKRIEYLIVRKVNGGSYGRKGKKTGVVSRNARRARSTYRR